MRAGRVGALVAWLFLYLLLLCCGLTALLVLYQDEIDFSLIQNWPQINGLRLIFFIESSMDILYYWKDVEQDILTNKIGWLRSEQGVLAELASTPADNLWLVKTPAGRKGELELLGKVCLVEKPVIPVPRLNALSVVYYDPFHPASLWFAESNPACNREQVTLWMRRHFPAAVKGNFQGANGVQALRGHVLLQLQQLAAKLQPQPFASILHATELA